MLRLGQKWTGVQKWTGGGVSSERRYQLNSCAKLLGEQNRHNSCAKILGEQNRHNSCAKIFGRVESTQ